jgi:hypothetical protein
MSETLIGVAIDAALKPRVEARADGVNTERDCAFGRDRDWAVLQFPQQIVA